MIIFGLVGNFGKIKFPLMAVGHDLFGLKHACLMVIVFMLLLFVTTNVLEIVGGGIDHPSRPLSMHMGAVISGQSWEELLTGIFVLSTIPYSFLILNLPQFIRSLSKIRRIGRDTVLVVLLSVFRLFGVALFLFLCFITLKWIGKNHPIVVKVFLALLFIFYGVLFIILFSKPAVSGLGWAKDRLQFRKIGTLPTTRLQIAHALNSFKTASGRIAYVHWLSAHAADLDPVMKSVGGQWPNNVRP